MTESDLREREHDRLYLAEDRRKNPKEIFKFLGRHLDPFVQAHPSASLADIGCATGDFLYYLRGLYPDLKLSGIDVQPDLIQRGKEFKIPAALHIGSLLDKKTLPARTFDLLTMTGVHSIFDRLADWLPNFLSLSAPGGELFVFGQFNPSPVDVWVRYRRSDAESDGDPDQRGWNVVSMASVSRVLDARSLPHQFIPFEIPIDVAKHAEDPLRAWTFKDAEGRRLHTNGTTLILYFHLLHIQNRPT